MIKLFETLGELLKGKELYDHTQLLFFM